MPAATVVRRWTVATWLVAGVRNEAETIARALEQLPADAIALQSIGHDEAATIHPPRSHGAPSIVMPWFIDALTAPAQPGAWVLDEP